MAHTDKKPSMKEKKETSQTRANIFRSIWLGVLLCVLGAVCFGVYEYNALNPLNHFKNLKAIGGQQTSASASASKGSSINTSKSTNTNTSAGGGNNNASSQTSQTSSKTYKVQKSGVFNVLLIGDDGAPGATATHTDSMLLIHVDLSTHNYQILSIPRDTRVYMNGYGYTKLTTVQFISQANNGKDQGIIDAVKAVSSLTGVPINYYAETNYKGLQYMVDAIGGIQMNVPYNVTFTHPWYKEDKNKVITKGVHRLSGKMVTEIVHERDSLPGTDYGRQQVQEAALVGIANKVMDPMNVTKLPALASSLTKFLVATNMTKSDMVSLALGVKNDFHPKKQIHYHQIKGKSKLIYDDILKANNDEIILDPKKIKSVVSQYFTG